MSALPDRYAPPLGADASHPRLHQRPLSQAEARGRWAVRAAQWRAREIAEAVFGGACRATVIGIRAGGELRGVLQLDVPFTDLPDHRDHEAAFMAAAASDPVLGAVPLVYVFGAHGA